MPAIKLKNGSVILKDGKVSCTCCESDCCMYPADGLGDTFEAADLPATLYGKWGDRADGTFTKSGSTFTRGTVTIRVNSGGTAWEFYDSEDDATSTIGNCLIRGDGGLTPENDAVEDQFADCYIINYGSIQFVNTGNLDRIGQCSWTTGICEWLGSSITGWSATLIYESAQWRIILNEPFPPWIEDDVVIEEGGCAGAGIFLKTGNQNTPIGTYSDGFNTLTLS
jgi:hypothetical protein